MVDDQSQFSSSRVLMKPIVLISCQRYLPSVDATGPVTSVKGLLYHLGDEFDFRILSADRDLKVDARPEVGDVPSDTWVESGGFWIHRMSRGNQTIRGFARAVNEVQPDVLYLNSFFDVRFTLKPVLARRLQLIRVPRLVVAPRGEFSQGALGIKAKKKKPYVALMRAAGFYKNASWQASSSYEATDIKRVMGRRGNKILVAPNLSVPPEKAASSRRAKAVSSGLTKILFLSRITPKKNLDGALRIISRLSVPVEFDIVGPLSDEAYWKRCQALIQTMPAHVTVRALGDVRHEDVFNLMAEHDLFFLPTHGENYGHVIVEALSAGTPVLISDTTPWRGLEQSGVGWDLPLGQESEFVSVIEKVAAMDSETRAGYRSRAARYAEKKISDKSAIAANRTLLSI